MSSTRPERAWEAVVDLVCQPRRRSRRLASRANEVAVSGDWLREHGAEQVGRFWYGPRVRVAFFEKSDGSNRTMDGTQAAAARH